MIYKGEKKNAISFPLGGIGTGCIGLAGNGRLIDWEIFNKPNKNSFNGLSHFAIKVEDDEKVLDARVLNSDLHTPHIGSVNKLYGHGVERESLTGVPHFKDATFEGEFPFANISFVDETFPGAVSMEAFNPLIPLNDKDSTIPAAFFTLNVANNTNKKLTYTVCMSLNNPLPLDGTVNTYETIDDIKLITLKTNKISADDTTYGELAVATDAGDVSYQEYWYRGGWFDNIGVFWRDFTMFGKFKNRNYVDDGKRTPDKINFSHDVCTLAAHITLQPGESKKIKFAVSWHFPNNHRYWDKSDEVVNKTPWKNYYAILFSGAKESALYAMENWVRLYQETKLFKDALFNSSLPMAAIDAVSANISILKSPTCLRLEDGSFYGWEGCNSDIGSCEGSCTHVWNYAYALPFLFPSLERSMRDLDYKYNLRDSGSMAFRLQLPLGAKISDFRACVDGQFGNVIKVYRDWKISGDSEWLEKLWPQVKKTIAFAWSDENEDKWDHDKDGVLEGRQHHTLDMEFFGPSSWLNGMYLAALKAGAEMATFFGEADTAKEYTTIFENGKKYMDNELFNGEYFIQKIDLKDEACIRRFASEDASAPWTHIEEYWNDEVKEIKYQIGEGSSIDQVLAQWHANLVGLGEIFDNTKTKSALAAIYKYNYKTNMRNVFNPCRVYSLNDESGTVICEWPNGVYKPIVPVPYSEETMNGFEYQAGIHMIQEGMIKEGMDVIAAIRNRYDGEGRNPWSEFECGSNYSRSMASYALLNAFSGFTFDMTKGYIGFSPIEEKEESKFFFSLDSGWGIAVKTKKTWEIHVLYGSLKIEKLGLPKEFMKQAQHADLNGENIPFEIKEDAVCFVQAVIAKKSQRLVISK